MIWHDLHYLVFTGISQTGLILVNPMPQPATMNDHRTLARVAWRHANGDLKVATNRFKELCGGNVPLHPKRFVSTWGPRQANGIATGRGRGRKITDSQATELAGIYVGGFKTCGQQRGYTSVKHAKRRSKKFAATVEACGNPNDRTVLRAMERADPELTKVKQTPKKRLTEANKVFRIKVARKNLRMGPRLKAVTWLDETHKYIQLKQVRVAGRRSKGDVVISDQFASKSKQQQVKIYALLAVNYAKGPLYCKILTGTSGVERTYKVTTKQGRNNMHLSMYLAAEI